MTAHSNTDELTRKAHRALDGKHPEYNFPIKDGTVQAAPYTLLALVTEQQTTNIQLASIAASLERIADALTTPAPESKRRLRLPGRRAA